MQADVPIECDLTNPSREFLAAVEHAGGEWGGLEVRAFAVRVGDLWRNCVTHARLIAAPLPVDRSLFPDIRTDRLLACRVMLAPTALPKLLASLTSGQVAIGDDQIEYRRPSGRDTRESYSEFWTTNEADATRSWLMSAWAPAGPDPWPSLVYVANGESLSGVLSPGDWDERDLDSHIHDVGLPFDGHLGVIEGMLRMRRTGQSDRVAQFRLHVPVAVRFDIERSSLHGRQLVVQVNAAGHAALATASVGVAAFSRGELILADVARPQPITGGPGEDALSGQVVYPEIEADRVVVTLRHGRLRTDGLTLEDPSRGGLNLRVQAFATADEGLTLLRTALFPKTSTKADTTGFERATNRLFFLLGFQAVHMGPEGELSNAPDVIVFDPYSVGAYAVECTIGSIDAGGKLGKLVQRTRELERVLGRSVEPVLVTSASRAALSAADLRDAGRDRISVVAREDLEDLLTLATTGSPTRDAAAMLTELIPPLPSDRAFRGLPSLGGIPI